MGVLDSHHEESDLDENTWCPIYLNHLIERLARIPEKGKQLDSNLDGAKSGCNLTTKKIDIL
jgi:hypothetical protein